MKLHITRTIAGALLAILILGVVFPLIFSGLATYLDNALGFDPFVTQSIAMILTAAAWLVGLFWVLWSYSYLLYVGRGSPFEAFGKALDPTKQLVTVGPYAFTRNPMILGYLWILLGIALYLRSISGIILVFLFSVLTVLYLRLFEEPELVKRFGEKYIHYREHVPILVPSWRVYIKPESALEELADAT